MSKDNLTIEYLKSLIEKAAKENNIHPSRITLRMLRDLDENVTDWKLREFGGITGLRKYFPITSKDLAEIKRQKDIQSYVNKLEKEVGNKILTEKSVLKIVDTAIRSLKPVRVSIKKPKPVKGKKKLTMELMLSDIHYGKRTDTFNLKVCRHRLRELTSVFMDEKDRKEKSGFTVDRIIIALIGDILESYEMHGLESALGCEFGTPKQISSAIESLFYDVILPIAETGVKIDVPCIAGNHDRTQTNRTFQNPGENYMSWVIYNALSGYAKIAGLKNVSFYIPKDSYHMLEIYGSNVLYEHGDNLKNIQKGTIENLIRDRGRQLGVQIDMIRIGHWHEYHCMDRGRAIVNESVCGQDSYAKVKGYASTPGQTINFYVDTKNRPTSFYYSFPVFLG